MAAKNLKNIPLLIAMGSIVACTSPSVLEPVIVNQNDAAGLNLNDKTPSLFVALAKASTSHKEAGSTPFKAFNADEAKAAFQLLCKAGKPRRKVEHRILFVIPHAPAGMPLDDANNYTANLQSVKDTLASYFYRLMAFGFHHDYVARRNVASTFSKDPPRGFPYLLDAEDQTTAEVVADLKNRSIAVERNRSQLLHLIMTDDRSDKHFAAVVVRTTPSKPEWIMTVLNPVTYFTKQQLSGPPYVRQTPPNRMRAFVPAELLAISDQYALVVSKSEAAEWHKIAKKRENGDLGGAVSNDSGLGKLLPQSELLREREEIMADYLVANTSVKESTTDDGQVFAFTLSLNTEPLCRSARMASGLESK